MVTSFPAAPDLPPGSLPAFRAMQAAIQDLQVDKLSLQSQLSAANAAISRGRQPTTLQQPDLVNANVMIGDAPTLYVDPYAYFTRSGDTQGGLNVSWDYRGPAGELLNGPSEQFEVWVREVRVESDYPAFADMRVDPPPTGDSYMALSTQSMYGVVVRLDIQTTYAVKVRSITSLGVPGNFSDETTVTTPKEPRIRPIDPPYVEQCGTDVCVTWDWTQDFQEPIADINLYLGKVAPVSGHVIGVKNGMVYTERSYDPDPTTSYDAVYEVWITDTSGNSSIVWTNIPIAPGFGWLENQRHNFTPGGPGGLYLPAGTIYSGTGSDYDMYFACLDGDDFHPLKKVSGPGYYGYDGDIFPSPTGFLRTVYTESSAVLVINTSTWTASAVVFTGVQFRINSYLGGSKYYATGRTTAVPGVDVSLIVDIATGTWVMPTFTGDSVAGLALYANWSQPFINGTYFSNIVEIRNLSEPSAFYRATYLGADTLDVQRITFIARPDYDAVNAYASAHVSDDYRTFVTYNSYSQVWECYAVLKSEVPEPATFGAGILQIPGGGGEWVGEASNNEILLYYPSIIRGQGGEPFPINPPTPWPEIKYVIAERLTITGWITVSTYNGPGTIRDSVAPGTYSYRLVPVSNTGVRGVPTAYMTITVV